RCLPRSRPCGKPALSEAIHPGRTLAPLARAGRLRPRPLASHGRAGRNSRGLSRTRAELARLENPARFGVAVEPHDEGGGARIDPAVEGLVPLAPLLPHVDPVPALVRRAELLRRQLLEPLRRVLGEMDEARGVRLAALERGIEAKPPVELGLRDGPAHVPLVRTALQALPPERHLDLPRLGDEERVRVGAANRDHTARTLRAHVAADLLRGKVRVNRRHPDAHGSLLALPIRL